MTAEVWQHGLEGSATCPIRTLKMGYELQLMLGQINGTHKYLVLKVVLPGSLCFLDPRLMFSDIRKDGIPSLRLENGSIYAHLHKDNKGK